MKFVLQFMQKKFQLKTNWRNIYCTRDYLV